MSCIDKGFDVFFSRIVTYGSILLNEDLNLDWLFNIDLEKEQLQLLLIVLETTNQV